jgi:hypothetical protein
VPAARRRRGEQEQCRYALDEGLLTFHTIAVPTAAAERLDRAGTHHQLVQRRVALVELDCG